MQTWTEKVDFGNGIFCYKGVIKKEIDVINRLESTLGSVADYGQLSFRRQKISLDASICWLSTTNARV